MSYQLTGHCPRCGAPIWSPTLWNGVIPPPATYSCGCFPQAVVTTTAANTAMIGTMPPSPPSEMKKAIDSLGDALEAGRKTPPHPFEKRVLTPLEKDIASLKAEVEGVNSLLKKVLSAFAQTLEKEEEKKTEDSAAHTARKAGRELLKG